MGWAIAILIIVHGVEIYIFVNYFKKFEENTKENLTNTFRVITRDISTFKDFINKQISELSNKQVDFIQKSNDSIKTFISTQIKQFQELNSKTITNYTEYKDKVNSINTSLSDLLGKLEVSNKSNLVIRQNIDDTNKVLQIITDKTKELIAEHESLISIFRNEYSKTLSILDERSKAKLIEIIAEGEVNLEHLISEYKNSLTTLAEHLNNEISSKLNLEPIKYFNLNIVEAKEKFNSDMSLVMNTINNINQNIDILYKKFEENSAKKKNWFG